MKKIIFLNKSLLQYRKDFYNLLKSELLKHDIEMEVIYGKSSNINFLNKDEVEINWAKYIPNKSFKIGRTELIWQPCLNEIKDKDIVIVESANKLLINYILILSRTFSKRKLAFWGHGRNIQANTNSLRNRFKYLFLNKCDWWFGYTKGTRDFLLSKNYPAEKITVVQNAIDTIGIRKFYSEIQEYELAELRKELGIQKDDPTAIFCGAMYPEKNFDFILEICHKVRQEIPNFNMIFIGSGIEANKLIMASEENSWIHYVGSKFGNERVKYFKISQIQLLPYYVGLGILDSFALETPVIVTSNSFHGPEIEYLEDGKNGYMTKDNSDDYLSKVIETLKNKTYLNLISGCRKTAEKITLEVMVENFKEGIISCLKAK